MKTAEFLETAKKEGYKAESLSSWFIINNLAETEDEQNVLRLLVDIAKQELAKSVAFTIKDELNPNINYL